MDENTSPLRDESQLTEALRLIAAWHTPAGKTPDTKCPNKMKTCLAAAAAIERLEAEVRSLRSQDAQRIIKLIEEYGDLAYAAGEKHTVAETVDVWNRIRSALYASPPSQPIASDVVAAPDARRRCESKGGSDYCYHCGKEMSGNIDECRVLTRGIPATAFGCAQEAEGEEVCAKWCGSTHTCPRTLAPAPDVLSRQSPVEADTHPLDALLPEICQLIDGCKLDWESQGCWSPWDQSVRDRITAYNLERMKSLRAPTVNERT